MEGFTPVTRIEKLLNEIAENTSGGGGGGTGLPEVTTDDNGDVLTVVEGEWAKAAPSGSDLPAVTSDDNGNVLTVVEGAWAKAAPSGGGLLWCNYSGDDDTGYKIDKSYNQIKAAIDNGVMPVMVRDTSDDWRTEIPNTVDIWGRDYFSMTWLVAYTTENDGPGYRVNFGEGWTFISTDADADMDVD